MTRSTDQYESPKNGQPRSTKRRPGGPARRLLLPPILVLAGVSATLAYVFATGGPHAVAATSNARLAGSASSAAGSQAAASVSPEAAQPSTRASAGPSDAAALAVSGGALPLQNNLTTQAAAWGAGGGGTELSAVSGQLGIATQAAGMHQYVQMKAACVRLASDVKAAQAGPPIPAAAMQALYTGALTELATGAANCQAAISQQASGDEYIVTHENSALLNQSASAFAAGAKDLFRATAQVEIVSRQKH